jgi:hypothetical protein
MEVDAMDRKPAISQGRCERILTLGGGKDSEWEGEDARLGAARVWGILALVLVPG